MIEADDAEVAGRITCLADQLTAEGYLTDPAWRTVLHAVPRHLFIPDAIWDDQHTPLLRSQDPRGWWERIYSDELIITQLDDGATEAGRVGRRISSSSSMPSIMLRMLTELDVTPGHRVLEIGTGTGWNAGLLCARLGTGDVTSIEIDPVLAARAAGALTRAGWPARVVCGDGSDGYPPTAPYDRVIATCAVQRVPPAWVAQTRPGGIILTPWGTPYFKGSLLKLGVGDDHSASGRVVGTSAFMWLRDQRTPTGHLKQMEASAERECDVESGVTDLHPYEPVNDYDAAFAIGVRVPGCQVTLAGDDDGDPQHYVLWLMDPVSGSWASLTHEPSAECYPVRQHGPRRLWDEIERAHRWWIDAGRPAFTRWGVTVTPSGNQRVWLDSPDGPNWIVPPAAVTADS